MERFSTTSFSVFSRIIFQDLLSSKNVGTPNETSSDLMTHNLLLHYGLYKEMEVFLSHKI